MLYYEASQDCMLTIAGELFGRSGYGIGMPKVGIIQVSTINTRIQSPANMLGEGVFIGFYKQEKGMKSLTV